MYKRQLHELEDHVEHLDLGNRDVSTVGGYLTSLIGRIPESGETIQLEDFRATILEADERTVRQVQFLRAKPKEIRAAGFESSN